MENENKEEETDWIEKLKKEYEEYLKQIKSHDR
jgi:hypothetical protein